MSDKEQQKAKKDEELRSYLYGRRGFTVRGEKAAIAKAFDVLSEVFECKQIQCDWIELTEKKR